MPVPIRISHAGGIATFDLGFSLMERCEVQLCLVQAGAVDLEVIEQDDCRLAVAAALTQLLTHDGAAGGVLDKLLPGYAPKLVLALEYALGSGDWEAVDAAVRSGLCEQVGARGRRASGESPIHMIALGTGNAVPGAW